MHGLPRSVAVYGVPRLDPGQVDALLGRYEQLRTWARAHSFDLAGVPEELGLLDQALDEAIDLARGELGGPMPIAAAGNQAACFSAP